MTIANLDASADDEPQDAEWYRGAVDAAFLSRFIVLQAIGASFVTALWIAGVASRPFEGATAAAPM
jgi:hypothetical protein